MRVDSWCFFRFRGRSKHRSHLSDRLCVCGVRPAAMCACRYQRPSFSGQVGVCGFCRPASNLLFIMMWSEPKIPARLTCGLGTLMLAGPLLSGGLKSIVKKACGPVGHVSVSYEKASSGSRKDSDSLRPQISESTADPVLASGRRAAGLGAGQVQWCCTSSSSGLSWTCRPVRGPVQQKRLHPGEDPEEGVRDLRTPPPSPSL